MYIRTTKYNLSSFSKQFYSIPKVLMFKPIFIVQQLKLRDGFIVKFVSTMAFIVVTSTIERLNY